MNNWTKFEARFTFVLAALTAILIVIILLVSQFDFQSEGAAGIDYQLWVNQSNVRKSATQLADRDGAYQELSADSFSTSSLYAYLWIEIQNNQDRERSMMFANRNSNYYTELLAPKPSGAVTMFRHGDIVPTYQTPVRSLNAAFPLSVPGKSTRTVVVEFHGPRGILITPELLGVTEFTNRTVTERSLIGGITGSFLTLVIISILGGILLRERVFFVIAAFDTSVFLFFLRQSRALLLYFDTLVYPEWLFPLTIFLNMAGAYLLAEGLFSRELPKSIRYFLRSMLGIGLVLVVISGFMIPYQIADILNLLSILMLLSLGFPIALVIRKRDVERIWIILTFVPWIVMMVLDILSGLGGLREPAFLKYRQIFGLLAHMFLGSSVLLNSIWLRFQRSVKQAQSEVERLRSQADQELLSLQGLSQSMVFELHNQLRRPVESIIATARILNRKFTNPQITAATQVIADEAIALKHQIQQTAGCIDEDDRILDRPDCRPLVELREQEDIDESAEHDHGTIWIFETDDRKATHLGLLLQAEGYRVNTAHTDISVLQAAVHQKVDTLILDPTSTGEGAYHLCRLIRDNHNLFELPILMITNYYADHLMQKGYAVGVNDFLTRPFEASELAVRVQTLVRLKQIAGHNLSLSQSEREKNAFLFFLTHNVNTPLTILLNRIRDLGSLKQSEDSGIGEIYDDLAVSSREINDIVQNVLISFRLSDGRQTVRLEDVDLQALLHSVIQDLSRKAENKDQHLSLDIPQDCPQAYGDYTAVKGILYNLIDNGIKFTPPGGTITVTVSSENPILVEVADTGPGIPEEETNKLFGRFEKLTTRPTGGESSTGLGLFVGRELARMVQGDLYYRVNTPHGSRFILQLTTYEEEIHG